MNNLHCQMGVFYSFLSNKKDFFKVTPFFFNHKKYIYIFFLVGYNYIKNDDTKDFMNVNLNNLNSYYER